MSKTDGKTQASAQAPTPAARAADVALVQPAPAAEAQPDESHGRGGLYTVIDGVRKLVEATKQPEE